MNAEGFTFDVPIDHDAETTVSNVPFRHQVLVPGAEPLGIRGKGGGTISPEGRRRGEQGGVDNLGNGAAEVVAGDIARWTCNRSL